MSIHFISGKPGGGKSLYALKLLVEELIHGTRPCYTNLPIIPGRLNEWLQQKYPEKNINLFERLRILDDDEAAKFWCYRPGVVLDVLNKKQWECGQRPDYSAIKDHGIFYAIDEIHNFFNSRAWMETGRDVLFYLSQHRKVGDTVICITQAINNVDKQFRSVSQDYTYLRNLAKEHMGMFKLPFIFLRKTYGAPATDTSKPMEQGSFRLYPDDLPSCYETAKGVGIHGKGADLTERRKGIHWSMAAVGIPICVIVFWLYAPKVVAGMWSTKDKVQAQHQVATRPATNQPVASFPAPLTRPGAISGSGLVPTEVMSNPRLAPAPLQDRTPEVFMTGVVQVPGKAMYVYLSDGRKYRVGEAALEYVARDYCKVEGKTYRMRF